MKPTLRAFTLIELLVVIAIIGILASLLFPAVNGAIDAARKAQAKNDVVQIATAVTGYETEYGRLPTNVSSMTVDFTRILTGQDTNNNTRKISFIEVGARKPDVVGKGGRSGTNATAFVDPWGNIYAIAMDADYDNNIQVSPTGEATGTTELRKKVAVWNVTTNTRRQVRSWE